jgi:ubiquinone/menaquinone biosynthesis C-methylase UbiE
LSWEIFEQRAHTYELWYETRRGRRAERAERTIIEWLLAPFPASRSLLEVGCGTGRFARWLTTRNMAAMGLDRSPAMVAQARRLAPDLPLVIGDGHALPFRAGAFDLVAFIVTLEFLADAGLALVEAVRVARHGVVVLALNRWSLGGLSRRHGRQRERPLLGQARDYSICSLRTAIARAASHRLLQLRWSCTLFPLCSGARAPIPLGDVIGLAARLDG